MRCTMFTLIANLSTLETYYIHLRRSQVGTQRKGVSPKMNSSGFVPNSPKGGDDEDVELFHVKQLVKQFRKVVYDVKRCQDESDAISQMIFYLYSEFRATHAYCNAIADSCDWIATPEDFEIALGYWEGIKRSISKLESKKSILHKQLGYHSKLAKKSASPSEQTKALHEIDRTAAIVSDARCLYHETLDVSFLKMATSVMPSAFHNDRDYSQVRADHRSPYYVSMNRGIWSPACLPNTNHSDEPGFSDPVRDVTKWSPGSIGAEKIVMSQGNQKNAKKDSVCHSSGSYASSRFL